MLGDDGGVLAAHLDDRRPWVGPAQGIPRHLHPHFIGAGEGPASNGRVVLQLLAYRAPGSTHIVEDARRQPGIGKKLGRLPARVEGGGGAFEDHGIARDQCGCNRRARQGHGKVEG